MVTHEADSDSHRGVCTAWSGGGGGAREAQEPGDLVSTAPWNAASDAGIGWEERVALSQDTAEAGQRACGQLSPLPPSHT